MEEYEPFVGSTERLVRFAFKELLNTKDIPVCNTRIIRAGKGYLLNRRIGVHPLKDGSLHITDIPD